MMGVDSAASTLRGCEKIGITSRQQENPEDYSELLGDSPVSSSPLKVIFLTTSMPVGGAEQLLVNLVRKINRSRLLPEIACLKQLGPLGEQLTAEVPSASHFLSHRLDLRVLPRLAMYLRERKVDAVVTVGAGDKMFWGRLAASLAGVPVIVSALHSTGWPDSIGRLNRLLTPITDAFVGVAEQHGRHLVQCERLPREKVRVIPNGVDGERFRRDPTANRLMRRRLHIPPDAPVCGIVAALRPEKNHELFLRAARDVLDRVTNARFLVIGDGPERPKLESLAAELQLRQAVQFLGTRSDTHSLLAALDVFALTSHNEANPVSVLEALASEVPVVATDVGSVAATVIDDQTGFLAQPGNIGQVADHVVNLFKHVDLRRRLGKNGRANVLADWSLYAMVRGYEDLILNIHAKKSRSNPNV